MRFIIKVGNHEESEWMDELKKFKAEYNGDKVTIDLNSWPAFVKLEKIFNDAPKVYPAFTYNTDISVIDLPVIAFRSIWDISSNYD